MFIFFARAKKTNQKKARPDLVLLRRIPSLRHLLRGRSRGDILPPAQPPPFGKLEGVRDACRAKRMHVPTAVSRRLAARIPYELAERR